MRKLSLMFILFLSLIGLNSCFKESAQSRIEYYSKTSLPEDMVEVYSFIDETFVGFAGQYTVFQLAEEPAMFDSIGIKELEDSEKREIVDILEDTYEVPLEYHPDFNKEYKYIIKNGIYIFYFPDSLEMKVFMRGH